MRFLTTLFEFTLSNIRSSSSGVKVKVTPSFTGSVYNTTTQISVKGMHFQAEELMLKE